MRRRAPAFSLPRRVTPPVHLGHRGTKGGAGFVGAAQERKSNTPKGNRIPVSTLKGWRPRPLGDGGAQANYTTRGRQVQRRLFSNVILRSPRRRRGDEGSRRFFVRLWRTQNDN